MDIKYRFKYYTSKTLHTFFGTSEFDEHNDPVARLERERAQRFGAKPEKPHKIHVPKRHFHSTHAA